MFGKRSNAAVIGLVACGFAVALAGCGGSGGGGVSSGGGTTDNSATLSWVAPVTQADGSTPLTELTGYRVHYGTAPRRYTNSVDVGNVTTYTVNNLAPGTYYFAVTAYNAGGDSDYSAEGSKTIH